MELYVSSDLAGGLRTAINKRKGDQAMITVNVRKIAAILVVVGALSAVAATSASAEWLVGGTTLVGSAALATQALVDENSTFLVPALGLSIVCSGHFLDGLRPQITAPDKAYAAGLTFLGCNTTVPATGCALPEANQPINTTAVLALAALGPGESVRVKFAPETKTTFLTLSFSEANTCAFNGDEPVTGLFIAGAPTGQLELLAQALTGLGSSEGNNSLQIAGDKAFIDGGRYLLRLASDSKWSFM
jgi:hypothetical protein